MDFLLSVQLHFTINHCYYSNQLDTIIYIKRGDQP